MVSVKDISKSDASLLKRVIDTAKIYYTKPEELEKSINDILEDD